MSESTDERIHFRLKELLPPNERVRNPESIPKSFLVRWKSEGHNVGYRKLLQ